MKISLFKNDLKMLKNTIIIFISLLLLCVLISLLSYTQDIPIGMFYVVVFVFLLIVPMINLNYLFNTTKLTHYSSFPYTKLQSFIIHYLSGLVSLIIPVFIFSIIDYLFCKGLIIANGSALLLVIWIYYSFGNLVAYLTTNIGNYIVLLLVFIFAPIVNYISLFAVYMTFVRGVIDSNLSNSVISVLIPIYNLVISGIEGLKFGYGLLYFGYGILILLLGFNACNKRSLESNYHGFSYRIVGELIKLIIIIVISWIITALLDIQVQSLNSFMIINTIATLSTAFIIQYLYSKKMKYLISFLQALFIILATFIIFIGTKGYLENYIPNNVAGVMIQGEYDYGKYRYVLNTSKEIDKVKDIHQQLIDKKVDGARKFVKVTYFKVNGDIITRGYYTSSSQYKDIISQFDNLMIRSWYSQYFAIKEEIEKLKPIDIYKVDNVDLSIHNENDLVLFNNLLSTYLQECVDNLDIISEVGDTMGTIIINNSSYSYYKNDPMDKCIEEFYKIKAN